MPEDKKLTKLERYQLSNQLKVLEALYPDEANDLAISREIFERGYELLYSWQLDHIYDGDQVMTADEAKEVWDTLDMFDALNRTISRTDNEELKNSPYSTFSGYDGNNESKFMAFAAFTVERLERFAYVPMTKAGYWNSHMPIRDVYQRMLGEWRTVPTNRRFDLSEDEVKRVLGAAVHPDGR